VDRTVVILVFSLLLLNFVVVPLVGLRIGSRRRIAADPALPHLQLRGSVGSGAGGLATGGYGSILLSRLVVQTCRVLAVDRACLLVSRGGDRHRMIAVVAHGLDEDAIGERVAVDGPLYAALRTGKAQHVDAPRVLAAFGPGTAVAMPAIAGSRPLLLCVAVAAPALNLDDREIALLRWLARLCAGAVEDLTMKDRLDTQVRVCADELTAASDYDRTGLPDPRVDAATLAARVGTRLDLEPAALIELDIAARVSQIGRPELPRARTASIAAGVKPPEATRLANTAEFAERMARLPGFEAVALIVRFIPERWDGRGPHGLPGHRIPLASRILAACNAMRVLTATRVREGGATVETALRQIQSASGMLFDPTVVAALSHELIGDMPELGGERTPAADWARADAQYAGVL
jgi:hypothetical protein